MNKKLVALCLCVAILASALTAGTLAYFTDKEQVTNTMTIGNVSINIEEMAKNPAWEEGSTTEEKYIPFDNNTFTLYPLANELGYVSYNKMVYTFNTSKKTNEDNNAAYIRTIVLVEYNEDAANACNDDCCLDGVHYAYTEAKEYSLWGKKFHTSTTKKFGVMEVGGKEYNVVVCTAKDEQPIKVGEALEAINAVWLDKNLTQEQVAGFGDNVEVKVFSQGIQSEGLTHAQAMEALGEVNVANLNTWFGTDDAVINDIIGK